MLRDHSPIILAPDYILVDANGVVVTAVGDAAVFQIPYRCSVQEAGVIVTVASGGATTTAVVDFDVRPAAGGDAGRTTATLGKIRLLTTVAGRVLYSLAGMGIPLAPGNEVVVEIVVAATGAGAAGRFRPYLLVSYIPEVQQNMASMILTT